MEMTVSELKAAIKAAGGYYSSRDLKATLVRKWSQLRRRASLEYPEKVDWKQVYQMNHRRAVLSTVSKFSQVSMYIPPTTPIPMILQFLNEELTLTLSVKHRFAKYGVRALKQVRDYVSQLSSLPSLGLIIFSRGDDDNLLFKAYASKKFIPSLIYKLDAKFIYIPEYIE